MRRQIIAVPRSNAYISYRPADLIVSVQSGDFNSCETALVHGADFTILSGDFREEAKRIINNEEKNAHANLIAFFKEKSIEWSSSWTSTSNVSDWVATR